MDMETRQMHRRAVAVAAVATIIAVLGQHAALRARAHSPSSDNPLLGEPRLADPIHRRDLDLTGGVKGSLGRAAARAKRGGACPAGASGAAPQLARWDGMDWQD